MNFIDKLDIDECKGENLCHKFANCKNTNGSYLCSCKSGFFGDGFSCIGIKNFLKKINK